VADVQPFRAIRYAHPSDDVVAPPYDVISREERERYLARDPHNVVHLTLNDSEEAAGELFRAWLDEGVLVEEDEPAVWALAQDYVGPDGVERRREGLVASLRVEPYEAGVVLPHERTHAGPKESRLRLLRATGAQVEPIFLLHHGPAPVRPPEREPDLAAEGTGLWRLPAADVSDVFSDLQLLIADGHHRYETALAYARERHSTDGGRMMVVLVSTDDPGLEIFPTHRVFSGRPDLAVAGEPVHTVEQALERLTASPYGHAVVAAYRPGDVRLVEGRPGELDVELVDRFGHDGIAYTPDWREAVGRVDRGGADIAFLLRPTRIEDVFERARRGEVLPPKSTYFFPKLTSGLLLARA
jgi:uncharacterized protein (DUF1015 family)